MDFIYLFIYLFKMNFLDNIKKQAWKMFQNKETPNILVWKEIFRYGKKGSKLWLLDVLKAKQNIQFHFWTKEKEKIWVNVFYDWSKKKYIYEIIWKNVTKACWTKSDLEKALASYLEKSWFTWKDKKTAIDISWTIFKAEDLSNFWNLNDLSSRKDDLKKTQEKVAQEEERKNRLVPSLWFLYLNGVDLWKMNDRQKENYLDELRDATRDFTKFYKNEEEIFKWINNINLKIKKIIVKFKEWFPDNTIDEILWYRRPYEEFEFIFIPNYIRKDSEWNYNDTYTVYSNNWDNPIKIWNDVYELKWLKFEEIERDRWKVWFYLVKNLKKKNFIIKLTKYNKSWIFTDIINIEDENNNNYDKYLK